MSILTFNGWSPDFVAALGSKFNALNEIFVDPSSLMRVSAGAEDKTAASKDADPRSGVSAVRDPPRANDSLNAGYFYKVNIRG